MAKKTKAEQAIGILYQQRDKLDERDYFADQVWITHTQSYIREYFGEHSEQYKYISEFRFINPGELTSDPKYELNKARVKRFLRESIEKIESQGLYKPPKKNFLNDMQQEALVGWVALIFSVIGVGSYTWGYQNGAHSNDVQNYKLTETTAKQTDTISMLKDTVARFRQLIAEMKTKKDTSNKNQQ